MSSSSAADWIGLLINFGNLVVNVLRLLGDEPVRRWFRQRAARLRGSGDTEMGQGSELDETSVWPPAPTAVPVPPLVIILPIFIFVPAPPPPPPTVFTEPPTVFTDSPSRSPSPDNVFPLPPSLLNTARLGYNRRSLIDVP
ncbi:hypothetical protein HDV63DRAFT_403544 [Trichoderma sp. SZMC 28014]